MKSYLKTKMAHFAAAFITSVALAGGTFNLAAQTCCLDMEPAGPIQVHVNAFDFNNANTLNTLADAGLVKAGNYIWWCIDVTTVHGNNVDDAPIFQNTLYLDGTLYSSCDPDLTTYPALSGTGMNNIHYLNYIINNKQGSYFDIQDAIWFFVGGPPAYANPVSAASQAMITGALANPNYQVPCGSNMAVVVDFPDQAPFRDGGAAFPPGYESYSTIPGNIQRLIIEVPCECPPCEITVSVNSDKICADSSATISAAVLTGTGPFSYAWTVPNGAANPGNTASFSATVEGTYSVVVTSDECTAGNGSGVLTIDPKPTVSVNSDEVCAGNSATITATVLTGTGPFQYVWTVPNGAVNPGNTGSFSASVQGTYSVVVTDSNGCESVISSGVLTGNTQPGLVVLAPETCLGTAATVSATVGYPNYQWTVPAGASAPGNVASFSTSVAGSYKVVVTDSKGCKATNSATLTFTRCCAITISVTSDKICQGFSALISATVLTGTGPYHYAWTVPAGAANPGDVASFSATVAGTYSVIVSSDICTDGNGSGVLTVDTKPTVSVTSDEICAGSSATISATVLTGTGPFSYLWTVPAGAANPGNVASFSASVQGTYSVIMTDSNGCKSSTSSGVLKVNNNPTLSVLAPETCLGTSGKVSATTGFANYKWTVPAGASAPGNVASFFTTVAGTYTVVVTDANGCKATNSATLKFIQCGEELRKGDTATIGYWQNKNGQALIKSMPNSPAFGNWLASNSPCLFGNLAGKSNDAVAAQFITYFEVTGQKTYAQVMAGAIATYVTDSDLAGNKAVPYGFTVTSAGTGAKVFNVGSNGTAIGLLNNTSHTVSELLKAANQKCPWSAEAFNALNSIFSGINEKGDI